MATSVQHDIMRLVVRGSLELLLHENADIIDIFTAANRPDLIVTLNTFESSGSSSNPTRMKSLHCESSTARPTRIALACSLGYSLTIF